MRYAIFSDVHSNLEAFEAVIFNFKKLNIDRYFFIGDIVSYGANPKECIAILKSLNPIMVCGNHDYAVAGVLDIEYFNDTAKEAVIWTQHNISENDRLFLSNLPLLKVEEDFYLVHGSLSQPEDFNYVNNGPEAIKAFSLLKQKICFIGHSHKPGIFVEDEEKVYYKEALKLVIEKGRRYIINCGSVGQPRDGDPKACFCVYDDEVSTVLFERVDYDIALAQKKIIAVGLPKMFADRLEIGY